MSGNNSEHAINFGQTAQTPFPPEHAINFGQTAPTRFPPEHPINFGQTAPTPFPPWHAAHTPLARWQGAHPSFVPGQVAHTAFAPGPDAHPPTFFDVGQGQFGLPAAPVPLPAAYMQPRTIIVLSEEEKKRDRERLKRIKDDERVERKAKQAARAARIAQEKVEKAARREQRQADRRAREAEIATARAARAAAKTGAKRLVRDGPRSAAHDRSSAGSQIPAPRPEGLGHQEPQQRLDFGPLLDSLAEGSQIPAPRPDSEGLGHQEPRQQLDFGTLPNSLAPLHSPVASLYSDGGVGMYDPRLHAPVGPQLPHVGEPSPCPSLPGGFEDGLRDQSSALDPRTRHDVLWGFVPVQQEQQQQARLPMVHNQPWGNADITDPQLLGFNQPVQDGRHQQHPQAQPQPRPQPQPQQEQHQLENVGPDMNIDWDEYIRDVLFEDGDFRL